MVFVVQISVSNKSYGCVDSIHAKEIVKNSYFECFPAILYLSFIRYHPVLNNLKFSAVKRDGGEFSERDIESFVSRLVSGDVREKFNIKFLKNWQSNFLTVNQFD